MEKRLVVIGIQETNLKLIEQQLKVILGNYIQIYGITLKELTKDKIRENDFVLLTTNEIRTIVSPFLRKGSTLLIASRSENLLKMRELFLLTDSKKVLVVNDDEKNTLQTVASLEELLPIHTFFPYVATEMVPNEIDIVITPGERDLIPAGFPHVYDIGSRIIALETIYELQEVMEIQIAHTLLNKLYFKSMVYINDEYVHQRVSPVVTDENKGRTFHQVQTNSLLLSQTFQKAKEFAMSKKVIHIEGEVGTGKQMLAEMIHNHSEFTIDTPFFTYNCLDKDPKMIQDDLFGDDKNKGLLYTFQTGTFFLKNIDTLPYTIQEHLTNSCVRIIDENQSNRIIISTIKSLKNLHEEGIIRDEIFELVCNNTLLLPPLKDRKEDLITLINDFKNHFHKNDLIFDKEALRVLTAYHWPGNLRELFNVISYCVCLETELITVETLPLIFKGTSSNQLEKLSIEEQNYVISVIEDIEKHGFLAESIALLEIYLDGRRKNEAYGRQKIKQLLEKKNIFLTEQQLRLRITILHDLKLVNVRKGRAGTTITSEGESFLIDYRQMKLIG